jgi:uncharacterized protein
MKRTIIVIVSICIGSLYIFPQTEPDGRWEGAINIMETDLGIIVTFISGAEEPAATIDIPQQGAMNLQLSNVRFENDSVHFELPAGPGLAVFDGKIEGDAISGKFSQAGITGSFHLMRAQAGTEIEETEPMHYSEEHVHIKNEDVTLGCTLTIPFDGAPYPAVILITGSGAQDRDETIFGFKPFRLIADHFTRNGIAVLRCDDRGVGESTGSVSTSTSKDFSRDVNALVNFLTEREDISDNRIGLCGHSEGGIIAAMTAAENSRIAFVISLAGSAVPGRDILIAQSELIFRVTGVDETITRKQIDLINRAYEAAGTDEGWDEIETLVRGLITEQLGQMSEEQRTSIQDMDQFLEQRVDGAMAGIRSEWYRFFIRHNPAENWERINQPVLALFGEFDLQVPPEVNAEALQAALISAGNTDYTIQIIPGANHLFQKAVTGSPTEYAQLEKAFIDGMLETITDWVKERVM